MHCDTYCNNCGKLGHLYSNCKLPIISIGIVAFTFDTTIQKHKYLMIRRKDTLGYMDFVRGKYSIYNKDYLLNLLNQMTICEKKRILESDFDSLWSSIWYNTSSQYKNEENTSRDKYNSLILGITTQKETYTLGDLINLSNKSSFWTEPEWGFPKGRREHNENDIHCAIREFSEETGYSPEILHNIENIHPFEEIFMGSNYRSYKHKYYLTMIPESNIDNRASFDTSEVSKMEWKTIDECLLCIRDYNLEKKNVITNINSCLINCKLV
jgi:ADP-ribose pyrophosphatase YjhB (NUDIX family)